MTKIATKSKKTTKPIKYIRLPVDQKVQSLIDQVQTENPFFDDLYAIRYMLGKFAITTGSSINKQRLLNWLQKNVEQKQLPAMTEAEIIEIINQI